MLKMESYLLFCERSNNLSGIAYKWQPIVIVARKESKQYLNTAVSLTKMNNITEFVCKNLPNQIMYQNDSEAFTLMLGVKGYIKKENCNLLLLN